MMATQTIPLNLSRKDFVSDQEVRWCPGCGDYAILAQVQRVMPELGVPKEKIVFISGIGCSSRFPYYMNTYGIHSIHGRAPTLATGLAIANPDLHVFVITGDGDGLSIGGNHLLHALRRNINLTVILFNNRIYGLTKGQYSPTSRQGARTKTSPMGTVEQPLNPLAVALAAESTFVARSIDVDTRHLAEVLAQAAQHKGISFIEVFQNCVIFNPGEWAGWTERGVRDDHFIRLEHGKPLKFGKDLDRGIILDGFTPKVVYLADGYRDEDLLVHDESSRQLANILASMEHPDYPTPMGVLRRVRRPTYGEGLFGQIETAKARNGEGDLSTLYRTADLWTVSAHADVEASVKGEMTQGLDEQYVTEMEQADAEAGGMEDLLAVEAIASLNPHAPIILQTNSTMANAVQTMNQHKIGCVLATDDSGKLFGILTEKDILMRVAGLVTDLAEAQLNDFMTPEPYALKSDMPIAHALHLMAVHGFRHLPLVNDKYEPTGVVSFRDVVRYLRTSLAS